MAADYEIRVTGALQTQRNLRGVDEEIRRAMRRATRDAEHVVHRAAVSLAPAEIGDQPQGFGIRTEIKEPFRLAGRFSRAQGGGFRTAQAYQIDVVIDERKARRRSIAAAHETGTGLFRDPEYGGPRTSWTVRTKKKGIPFVIGDNPVTGEGGGKPRVDRDGLGMVLFRKEATIRGMRPRPFLWKIANLVGDEVEVIYESAVRRATIT